MFSTTISHRPFSSINWADDDEDDFDIEAWKSNADISAPAVDSLPPLQLPPVEEEPLWIVCGGESINQTTHWAAEQLQEPEIVQLDLSTINWRYGKPSLAVRAVNDHPALPAYPEMSTWDGGLFCSSQRTNYSQNWAKSKVNAGYNCKYTAQLRPSTLRQVTFSEPEEVFTELEEYKLEAEIFGKEDLDFVVEDSKLEAEDSTPSTSTTTSSCAAVVDPAIFPQHIILEQGDIASQSAQDVYITPEDTTPPEPQLFTNAFAPRCCTSTTGNVSETVRALDEGYYSDESSTTSPTFSTFDKDVNVPLCTIQVGISPATSFITIRKPTRKHCRYNSTEALKDIRKQDEADLANDGPLDDIDLTEDTAPSPGFKDIGKNHGNSAWLSDTIAMGWFYMSSMPWTTATITTTSIIVGGAFHLARRR